MKSAKLPRSMSLLHTSLAKSMNCSQWTAIFSLRGRRQHAFSLKRNTCLFKQAGALVLCFGAAAREVNLCNSTPGHVTATSTMQCKLTQPHQTFDRWQRSVAHPCSGLEMQHGGYAGLQRGMLQP